jgi:hypothetical protein
MSAQTTKQITWIYVSYKLQIKLQIKLAQTTKQITWIYVSSNYKTNTVDLCQLKL